MTAIVPPGQVGPVGDAEKGYPNLVHLGPWVHQSTGTSQEVGPLISFPSTSSSPHCSSSLLFLLVFQLKLVYPKVKQEMS